MGLKDTLIHAWNVFTKPDESYGSGSSFQRGSVSYGSTPPQRQRTRVSNDRSIISSIYTRLSIDVSQVDITHVKVDQNGRYKETVASFLNECLTLDANMDQSAIAFKQDMAMTLFEEGVIAIVPVETDINPEVSMAFDVKELQIGKIVEWFPDRVKISVYDQETGKRQDVVMLKKSVAIVENPLYSVMNQPNGTLQRLIRKLSLLDSIDEAAGSGKLDLIIQLPYVIKSEARRQQANNRRADIEDQLKNGKYGIAYTDGTERITQLNRPAENNMLAQIEKLESSLYSQLGLTAGVFDGTASEAEMLNYNNRTIKPILKAVTQEMTRKFVSKTARSKSYGHQIVFNVDAFSLMPVSAIAELGDKFIRNKIMTPNEIRGILGMKPADDESADKLNNPNMPNEDPPNGPETPSEPKPPAAT
ncbi:portal protein [Arthrobacter phage Nightmare]|uniref:Portal protein n=2 Tax=Gordonvirus TaxID=1982152 RepID=A0A9E7P7L8_9CAUD|nr:portal protein [Arthrobacter phage Nightmare]YP_010750645.1 portal protein [Arthrobacter phage ScienceWizSam]ASM62289.1 portal protein [Arthrobacter phage Nightmare]UUG69257.1 portal protein [Arthrobacter phage ScienceWizSam]